MSNIHKHPSIRVYDMSPIVVIHIYTVILICCLHAVSTVNKKNLNEIQFIINFIIIFNLDNQALSF